MKPIIFIVSMCLVVWFASCKKSSTTPSGNNTGSGTQLVRIQEGTMPSTDTVFKIVYTGNNIHYIYDSIYYGDTSNPDTLTVAYDGNGRLSSASDIDGFSATYTYNSSGLLQQIDAMVVGGHDIYAYTYTGSIISQKTWSTDAGQGGTPALYQVSKYTITNGNITELKKYDAGNSLLDDVTFTYGSQVQPGTFKELGLLNIGNVLGFDNFTGFDQDAFDSYLNTNMATSYTDNGTTTTLTNTFNTQQLPTEIIANNPSVNLSTWFFGYN